MRKKRDGMMVGIFAALLAAGLLLISGDARAELRVDITRGNVQPLPIALPAFYGSSARDSDFGRQIVDVVSADLARSGLFRPIDSRAFIQTAESLRIRPRFADWRLINAQALVNGSVRTMPDGRIRAEFRLWDVFAEKQMTGHRYSTPPGNWRRVAHIISDAIYKRITGEDGYFDTRVVYIAETGTATKRIKRLALMDQDGANLRYLTNGASLVLTPRFSPTAQEITYLSYVGGTPRVYLYNIDTGQQEVLGDFPGMTFAPRFAPDGNSVIMTYSSEGNSEIYEMDLRTRNVRRLTRHPAIDTSPSFSPDRHYIVFNSDRGGTQQLYVMNNDGSDVRRISFGTGRYATPVWSPRGDLIAFTKIDKGEFYIGVLRPDGSGERLLTKGYLVESPTWAPNGRVLMFFRENRRRADGSGGEPQLYSIDLTGYNERLVKTPQGASDPAWSPSKR